MLRLPTFYCMDCPVCGRPLRVKLEMMGSEVGCSHCRALFLAESAAERNSVVSRWNDVGRRVESLLAGSRRQVAQEDSDFQIAPCPQEQVGCTTEEYQI